jgi:hypothetical protein
MNDPTSTVEQAQRRIGAAGKSGALVRSVRGKVMWVGRAMAFVTDLLRTGDRILLGSRIQANHGEIVTTTRRGVYVLVLVALFLTVEVEGKPGRDTSTAEVRLPPTGNIAPTTATLSPEPNAEGRNKDVAKVTLVARYKVH